MENENITIKLLKVAFQLCCRQLFQQLLVLWKLTELSVVFTLMSHDIYTSQLLKATPILRPPQ